MVALDRGDAAARLDQGRQRGERVGGIRQVLQHVADEDVVEASLGKARIEEVRHAKLDVADAFGARQRFRLGQRLRRNVDGDDVRTRALAGER